MLWEEPVCLLESELNWIFRTSVWNKVCWKFLCIYRRVWVRSTFICFRKLILFKLPAFIVTFYIRYQTPFLSLFFKLLYEKWSGPSYAWSIILLVLKWVLPRQHWDNHQFKLNSVISSEFASDTSFFKPNLDSSVGSANTMGVYRLVSR